MGAYKAEEFAGIWRGVKHKIDMEKVASKRGRRKQLDEFQRQLEQQTDQSHNLAKMKKHNHNTLMHEGLAETVAPTKRFKRTDLGRTAARWQRKQQTIEGVANALEKRGFKTEFKPKKSKGRGRKTTIKRTNLTGTAARMQGTLENGNKITVVRRKDTKNYNVYEQGKRGIVAHIRASALLERFKTA